MQRSCFVETPNTTIMVVDIEPQLMMDKLLATKVRKRLSGRYGGMPVLLRCEVAGAFFFNGERHLWRYGIDQVIDALPAVMIDLDSLVDEAARALQRRDERSSEHERGRRPRSSQRAVRPASGERNGADPGATR
jgi:hypothetical protein